MTTEPTISLGEKWIAISSNMEMLTYWLAQIGLLPNTGLVIHKSLPEGFLHDEWTFIYLNDPNKPVGQSRSLYNNTVNVMISSIITLPSETRSRAKHAPHWISYESAGCIRPARGMDATKAGLFGESRARALEAVFTAIKHEGLTSVRGSPLGEVIAQYIAPAVPPAPMAERRASPEVIARLLAWRDDYERADPARANPSRRRSPISKRQALAQLDVDRFRAALPTD